MPLGRGSPGLRSRSGEGSDSLLKAAAGLPTGDAGELGEEEGRESSRYGWGVRLDAPRGPRGFSLKLRNVDVVAPCVGSVGAAWGGTAPGVGGRTPARPGSARWGRTRCGTIARRPCACAQGALVLVLVGDSPREMPPCVFSSPFSRSPQGLFT